jgi:hypothetical protein
MAQPGQIPLIPELHLPPSYCQYAAGPCDQKFDQPIANDVLFLFASQPDTISSTIEDAAKALQLARGDKRFATWKDLGTDGQILFCQICKAIRYSRIVVADVTTLNFNLLFELGYAIGLGVPVIPIRDTTYIRDKKDFDELGLLDTLGYFDFHNSAELADGLLQRLESVPLSLQVPAMNNEQPLYLIKSTVENDGMVKLMSLVKKSRVKFRSFDSRETSRLSLHEAYKQTLSSRAVILHLLSSNRDARVHNARCAFLAGMAMAAKKHVLLLQESQQTQPIDYRDVVLFYQRASQIPDLVTPMLGQVIDEIQTSRFLATPLPTKPLEKLDLGDLAAENEIKALDFYYVPTAQFTQAKNGHARLVVGRKGSGKTALFYALRSTYRPSLSHLVLDLKPEGHQFQKLREAIRELKPGVQQHLLTAFWNYLLIQELARQIVKHESHVPYRDRRLRAAFDRVAELYGDAEDDSEQGDFSERLLTIVDDVILHRGVFSQIASPEKITEIMHGEPIRKLNDALTDYFSVSHRDVWMLLDNLDKSWPVKTATAEDIELLRCLLNASRKIQRQFESRDVALHSVVFIRNDIYQHLILDPAERGKDTEVILDWNDHELFKQIVGRRMSQSVGGELSFEALWHMFFTPQVRGQASFDYILNHTLMKPREVLKFIRDCVNVGINRRREKVAEEDILQAEKSYSQDALVDLTLDMKDVKPSFADVPYLFIGADSHLSIHTAEQMVRDGGFPGEAQQVIELLLWFGFLGIHSQGDERYSFEYEHNIKQMQAGIKNYNYCIHPAFRSALGSSEG